MCSLDVSIFRMIHYAGLRFLSGEDQAALSVAAWVYTVASTVIDYSADKTRSALFFSPQAQSLTMLSRIYNGLTPYGSPGFYVPLASSMSLEQYIPNLLSTHQALEVAYHGVLGTWRTYSIEIVNFANCRGMSCILHVHKCMCIAVCKDNLMAKTQMY